MKLFLKILTVLLALPLCAFVIAGRPLSDLTGLFSAGADVAVDSAIDQIPTEIRDRKLDHDVQQQRQQLTDHQVALNLSRRELDTLAEQVRVLEERKGRRQRLLAEAYPLLQQATIEHRAEVQFAGNKHTLAEFQRNLDALLVDDERESRVFGIRAEGL